MTKALAKTPDGSEHLPASEAAAIFSMIERVASAPDVPIERVEQLFKLYTQMDAERARRSYHAAFSKMQPSLPVVERKGQGHNSKYARFEDIVDAVRPVLAAHGFAMSFRTEEASNKATVKCILSHSDGHSESTQYTFPYDPSGNKNAIQAIGSAFSYGQRYTMNALLGIATKGADDDGKAAGNTAEPSTEDQRKTMNDLIKKTDSDIGWLCSHYSVETLDDMTKKQVEDCIGKLQSKLQHMKKQEAKQ